MESVQVKTTTIEEINKLVDNLQVEEVEFVRKVPEKQAEDELKKLRKKQKKIITELKDFAAANEDNPAKVQDKINKLMTELRVLAEEYAGNKKTYDSLIVTHQKGQEEKVKIYKQKDTFENLHKTFVAQYQEQLDQNKKLQEDEKVKRQELADQFQQKIKDIQVNVEEKSRDRIQKEKENEILKEKLQDVNKQFMTTELIFGTQLKKKDLELQLQEARLSQELDTIKKQASLVSKLTEEIQSQKELDSKMQERLDILQREEDKFTATMVASNQRFTSYKECFDLVAENQKKTDSQINDVKRKCEKTDSALIDVVEKNVKLKEELAKQTNQLEGLESLLAALEKQLAEKTAQ